MNSKDTEIIRSLANRWLELASLPIMDTRKRQWSALKDLKQERPMILVEVDDIEHFVMQKELKCEDSYMREIEYRLMMGIRHAEEIGDDFILERHFDMTWDINMSDYGIPINVTKGDDGRDSGKSWGFVYDHPIHTPEDINRLKKRQFSVDRKSTLEKKEQLEYALNGILPVKLSCSQYSTHCLIGAISNETFKLLGMEKMFMWMYDEPEALQRILKFIQDDRIAMFNWMQNEKLLGLNIESMFIGSGSPGYTTSLPSANYNGDVTLKDVWLWTESQETSSISPENFKEFYLPYMAKVASLFGLVYYGCCEPVHKIWDDVIKAIPNIRAVSVSPWCDREKIAEKLGKNIVFSRKSMPTNVSGANPDFNAFKQDVTETVNAAKNCNLEFIFRDIIDINGDRARLPKMVEITKSVIG